MPFTIPGRTARVLAAVAVLLAACDAERPRPNVLIIMADDLGYNDLAINNGNTTIRTPAMDALAREGVRFTRHYADAVCSPARAALLTGLHPARLGFEPNGRGISPQLITLAEAFRNNGYRTMHIGKWHVGDTLRDAWPDRQGFEHWFGFLNQWYLAGEHEDGHLVLGADRHEDPWLMRDGDAGARYRGDLDDILTMEATRQIRELGKAGRPWFINLWYYLPHSPITPSPAFALRYPDTTEGRYRAMLEQLDTNVGRVLRELADTGEERSTIVVLVSDNGAASAKADSNAPFYGIKTTFFEGGVRTPLLIRWPDGHGSGTVDTRVAAIHDIFPTLLSGTGIEVPPGLDGRDLADANDTPRDLFWESYARGQFDYSVLHQGQWRLYGLWQSAARDVPSMLFDVNAPPWVPGATPQAPVDVAAQKPELHAELDQRWRAWHRAVHAPALSFERAGRNAGMLTGLDFLRTPGFGGFSFALAFDGGYAGRLAEQQGTWSMRVDGSGATVATFGSHTVSGQVAPADCHTAIVSTWFRQHISTRPTARDFLHLALYLDGKLVDSRDADAHIDDAQFAAPTLIGQAPGPDGSPGTGAPLLLTVPVESSEVWQVPELHTELCADLRAQPGRQMK